MIKKDKKLVDWLIEYLVGGQRLFHALEHHVFLLKMIIRLQSIRIVCRSSTWSASLILVSSSVLFPLNFVGVAIAEGGVTERERFLIGEIGSSTGGAERGSK